MELGAKLCVPSVPQTPCGTTATTPRCWRVLPQPLQQPPRRNPALADPKHAGNTPRRERQTVPLTKYIKFNVSASLMAPHIIMCNINLQINCGTFESSFNCCRNESWLITIISKSILVTRLCLTKLLLLAHYFNSSAPQELPFFGHLHILTGIYLTAAALSSGISSAGEPTLVNHLPRAPGVSRSPWREPLSLERKKNQRIFILKMTIVRKRGCPVWVWASPLAPSPSPAAPDPPRTPPNPLGKLFVANYLLSFNYQVLAPIS